MYKGVAEGLRRATAVHKIAPQKGYVGEDVLPDFGHMTLEQCADERRRLMFERSGLENELRAAKGRGEVKVGHGLGHRIQSIEKRLGALRVRMAALNRQGEGRAYRQAIVDVCPEFKEAIEARRRELQQAPPPAGDGDA